MPALQTNIQQELQKPYNPAGWVELYTLDASHINGLVYRFTNFTSASGGPLVMGGVSYQPIPIQCEGFDVTSKGTLPKPTVTISNVSKTLLNAVLAYGDLVGARFIRVGTYDKFLDGGTAANTAAIKGPETWLVEQMIHRDATTIQWSLTTTMDRFSFKFGRQILKDRSVKHLYAPGVARSRI